MAPQKAYAEARDALIEYALELVRQDLKQRTHRNPTKKQILSLLIVYLKGGLVARIGNNLIEQEERRLGTAHENWSISHMVSFLNSMSESLRDATEYIRRRSRGRPKKGKSERIVGSKIPTVSNRQRSRELQRQLFHFTKNWKQGKYAALEMYGKTPGAAKAALEKNIQNGHIRPEEIENSVKDSLAVRAFINHIGGDVDLEPRLRKALSRRRTS